MTATEWTILTSLALAMAAFKVALALRWLLARGRAEQARQAPEYLGGVRRDWL